MDIKVDITANLHIHAGPATGDVQTILASLSGISTQMSQLSDAVAALQASVTSETSIEQSALLLIQGIPDIVAAALAAAGTDATSATTAVNAVIQAINASDGALARAVTANTQGPAVITVAGGPFTGTVGQPFTGQMTSTGGVGTVTFTSSDLPSGISMDATGALTGTFAVGNSNVTATDSSPTPIVSAPFAVSFTDVAGATANPNASPQRGLNPDGSFSETGSNTPMQGPAAAPGVFSPEDPNNPPVATPVPAPAS